jgi:hypothetical protein
MDPHRRCLSDTHELGSESVVLRAVLYMWAVIYRVAKLLKSARNVKAATTKTYNLREITPSKLLVKA